MKVTQKIISRVIDEIKRCPESWILDNATALSAEVNLDTSGSRCPLATISHECEVLADSDDFNAHEIASALIFYGLVDAVQEIAEKYGQIDTFITYRVDDVFRVKNKIAAKMYFEFVVK